MIPFLQAVSDANIDVNQTIQNTQGTSGFSSSIQNFNAMKDIVGQIGSLTLQLGQQFLTAFHADSKGVITFLLIMVGLYLLTRTGPFEWTNKIPDAAFYPLLFVAGVILMGFVGQTIYNWLGVYISG